MLVLVAADDDDSIEEYHCYLQYDEEDEKQAEGNFESLDALQTSGEGRNMVDNCQFIRYHLTKLLQLIQVYRLG